MAAETQRLPLALTVPLVLLGFASNSLLCRAALVSGEIDAFVFTAVRLGTGSVVLLALALLLRQPLRRPRLVPALALACYALAFSWAYRDVTAGTGALLLFGAVQVTMLTSARGGPWRSWAGAALAFGGVVVVSLPSARAPPLLGALAMVGAGVAWGFYSLWGRGSTSPVADSAASFVGASLLALPFLLLTGGVAPSARALGWAVLSGGLASGATYALWYAVLPRLGAFRAAVVQLCVPLLAAAGASLLLDELPGPAWFLAAGLVVTGVILAAGRK